VILIPSVKETHSPLAEPMLKATLMGSPLLLGHDRFRIRGTALSRVKDDGTEDTDQVSTVLATITAGDPLSGRRLYYSLHLETLPPAK